MLGILKTLYNKTPVPIQNFIVSVFNMNPYSQKKIWKKVAEIDNLVQSFFRDNQSFLLYIEKNLKSMIEFAKNESLYWKKRFNNYDYSDINTYEQIKTIDNDEMRRNFNEIIVKSIPGYYTSTGGSGRNPSKLYLSDESYYLDIAHVLWSWSKIGFTPGARKLTLRGVNLRNKITNYNPIYNELQINIFKMDPKNIYHIIDAIKKFNPLFGHGYPSAFVRFATLVPNIRENLSLKGISLASESVNKEQLKIIREAFQCPVTAFYGHSERACFATQLPNYDDSYFVLPSYGLVEILDENGKRVSKGGFGEITCTSFINKGMPLFRYRTGDYATVIKEINGIPLLLSNISGRWGIDFIITKNGNHISTTAINVHSKYQYDFKYIQLWQTEKGHVEIKLVPWKIMKNSNKSLKLLLKEFREKLDDVEVSATLCTDNDIYFTHRGKVPYLVSKIKKI